MSRTTPNPKDLAAELRRRHDDLIAAAAANLLDAQAATMREMWEENARLRVEAHALRARVDQEIIAWGRRLGGERRDTLAFLTENAKGWEREARNAAVPDLRWRHEAQADTVAHLARLIERGDHEGAASRVGRVAWADVPEGALVRDDKGRLCVRQEGREIIIINDGVTARDVGPWSMRTPCSVTIVSLDGASHLPAEVVR